MPLYDFSKKRCVASLWRSSPCHAGIHLPFHWLEILFMSFYTFQGLKIKGVWKGHEVITLQSFIFCCSKCRPVETVTLSTENMNAKLVPPFFFFWKRRRERWVLEGFNHIVVVTNSAIFWIRILSVTRKYESQTHMWLSSCYVCRRDGITLSRANSTCGRPFSP